MTAQDIAIYISTTRRDYYLCKALVVSLEAHADHPQIYILPDDDYKVETIFGYPVWRPEDPRVLALDHFYKKLRVFWGPAERFLYLDADQLALKDIHDFLNMIATAQAPFFMVSVDSEHRQLWEQLGAEAYLRAHGWFMGKADLIRQFDPGYDMTKRMPFGSGAFTAHRDLIDKELFLDLFEKALAFHAMQNDPQPMTKSRNALFMGDQGFLNYFLSSQDIAVTWLDDLFLWGSDHNLYRHYDPTMPYAGLFVHWFNCPRPGPVPFIKGIPAAREWRQMYHTYCRTYGDLRDYVRDSIFYSVYAMKIAKSRLSIMKHKMLRKKE
ncbi:MAG: hypothetical protein JXA33_29610 [Anaerolineae bacterium]|nr:hypothetical protein [Anaerolineae bacterium]